MRILASGVYGKGFPKLVAVSRPRCEHPSGWSARAAPRWFRRALIALGGGTFVVTLMACGGGPPCTGLALCLPPDLSSASGMPGCADGGANPFCPHGDGGSH